MDGPRFLSARVRGLSAFSGVPTAASLARDPSSVSPVLLHLNECPYPPSPRVVDALCKAAAGVNRYGDPRPGDLAAALSARTGVDASNIVVGNGSDEVLALVAMMTLGPGDSAVMPTPSFPRYRIGTTMMGAQPFLVRNLPDGRNDVAGLLAAIDASTKVVFACTPNNPSGAPLTRSDLDALVHGVPEDVLLVMDEAYYEFDAAQGGEGTLDALRGRRGPWLSTRTLSKAESDRDPPQSDKYGVKVVEPVLDAMGIAHGRLTHRADAQHIPQAFERARATRKPFIFLVTRTPE